MKWAIVSTVTAVLVGAGVLFLYYSRPAPAVDQQPSSAGYKRLEDMISGFRDELASLPDTRELSGNIASLKNVVQDIQQNLSRLEGELQELREAGSGSNTAPPTKQAKANVKPAETPEEEHNIEQSWEDDNQYFSRVDEAFQSEEVDPQWSDSTTELVQQAFASEVSLTEISLDSVECRGATCRVEVSYADDLAAGDLELGLMGSITDQLPQQSIKYERHPNANGSRKAIVYLSREPQPGQSEESSEQTAN